MKYLLSNTIVLMRKMYLHMNRRNDFWEIERQERYKVEGEIA